MEEVLQLGTRVGTNDILISSILKKMPYYKKSEVLTLVSSINIPSLEKIKDLYQKSVGEMNISSADFFDMTEDEIEDAYNGYLRRKELEANLVLLALNKSLANDTKPIKIAKEKNYIIDSLEERKQTFDSFNV